MLRRFRCKIEFLKQSVLACGSFDDLLSTSLKGNSWQVTCLLTYVNNLKPFSFILFTFLNDPLIDNTICTNFQPNRVSNTMHRNEGCGG